MQITGILESLEPGTAKNGKAFHKLIIDGSLIFCWNKKLVEGFSAGASVVADFEGDDYLVLTKLQDHPAGQKVVGEFANPTKDLKIARQVALYAAVDTWKYSTAAGDEEIAVQARVLATAKVFEEWLNR